MMRLQCGMAAMCLLLIAGVSDELRGEQPHFEFQRPVDLPALDAEELIAVALDAEVFAVTSDDLADLRLFNDRHQRVPFLLRTAAETRTQATRRYREVQPRAARPLEDNALEILIELDEKDLPVQGIRLVSPLTDFQHRVRVFASASGQDWQPLAEEGLIFDYSRFIDVRNDSVAFPETRLRNFRIVIDDVTAQQQSRLLQLTRELVRDDEVARSEQVVIDRRPLRVSKVQFWQEVHQQRVVEQKRVAYPLASMHVEPEPSAGQTVLTLKTRREPLTQFTLVTPTKNFSRRVTVQVPQTSGVSASWRTIAAGTLSQLDFKDLHREELSIRFPETRQRQYRLIIEDRDSPAIEVSDVLAEGSVKEVVFFAAPEQRLRLAYGHDQMAAADFDSSAITAALRQGYQPQPAELGPRQPGPPLADAPAADLRAILNQPGVMFGVIALLVVVLGWFLYQAGRRLESSSQTTQ